MIKPIQETTQYFLYCRKSTEEKERQVLSLETQEEEMLKIAQRDGLKVTRIFRESKSAKEPGIRLVFAEILARVKSGEANGILCWKIDRLARNPDEAGQLIGMLHRNELRHIKTVDKDYFSDDNAVIPFVEFGIANQFSRDLSKNVKRGIDKKASLGWRPSVAPLGYLNSKIKLKGEQDISSDPERFHLVKQLFQRMLTGNYTVPKLLQVANEELGLTLPASPHRPVRKMRLSGLYTLLSNPFYYGFFEWPGGSCNWLQGKHDPMITANEFDQIQFLLGRKGRPRPKKHQFAFTGLMRCGSCLAAITAEEKFKKQKNGRVHHYIYYHCTKRKDPNCEEKAIELKTFEKYVDSLLDQISISEDFKNWAIAYLHEIRRNEAKAQEESLAAKQKRYKDVVTQMDNLVIHYTAPENNEKQLFGEEEFKRVRFRLLREKGDLEVALKNAGEKIEDWLELSVRTFNFACYARAWFAKGDSATKRTILACLGSNLFLMSKKPIIDLEKFIRGVSDKLPQGGSELKRLEPLKNGLNKGEMESIASKFPVLSGIVHEVRTYWMKAVHKKFIPKLSADKAEINQ